MSRLRKKRNKAKERCQLNVGESHESRNTVESDTVGRAGAKFFPLAPDISKSTHNTHAPPKPRKGAPSQRLAKNKEVRQMGRAASSKHHHQRATKGREQRSRDNRKCSRMQGLVPFKTGSPRPSVAYRRPSAKTSFHTHADPGQERSHREESGNTFHESLRRASRPIHALRVNRDVSGERKILTPVDVVGANCI